MKTNLNRIISCLNSKRNGYCRIKHKRGWMEYLRDGDPGFSPRELHTVLRTIIDCDAGMPRGSKLLCRRRRLSFTMMPDKTPYRIEEALERFIVVSNGENFCNQIPIGGGKESIDIGMQDTGSKFTFVELKPWGSQNSPLYAVVESLKNLISYRIIIERNLVADTPWIGRVELMVLAPFDYYRDYGLDSAPNIDTLQRTIEDLSEEFQTRVSFMALDRDKESFLDACRSVFERSGLSGKMVMDISGEDPIQGLVKRNWRLVVESNGIETLSH